MKITYDEPKRLSNLSNRGLDFAGLDVMFFENSSIVAAKSDRFKAIGEFNGLVLTVIFKPLGTEALSIISMRRANRKERNAHGRP